MTHIERAKRDLRRAEKSLEAAGIHGAPSSDLRHLQSKVNYLRYVVKALEGVENTANNHFRGVTKMVPLTLKQLQGMDGEPAWIVEYPDWGHWELSEDASDYIVDRDTDLYGLTYPDPEGRAGLHKLGWLAYAYPPAQLDRGAWTAEWVKHDGYTECSKCEHWYDSPEVEDDGDRPAFCPSCGRAMKPGAWAMLEKRFMG